jgi:ABC-type transport system involved in cytochrome c biogenesis permease subunit
MTAFFELIAQFDGIYYAAMAFCIMGLVLGILAIARLSKPIE